MSPTNVVTSSSPRSRSRLKSRKSSGVTKSPKSPATKLSDKTTSLQLESPTPINDGKGQVRYNPSKVSVNSHWYNWLIINIFCNFRGETNLTVPPEIPPAFTLMITAVHLVTFPTPRLQYQAEKCTGTMTRLRARESGNSTRGSSSKCHQKQLQLQYAHQQ